MSELIMTLSIAVNWGPRAVSLDRGAMEAAHCFNLLQTQIKLINEWWNISGRQPRAGDEPIDVASIGHIRAILEAGQNRTDRVPKTVIEELGFRLSVWNRNVGGCDIKLILQLACNSQSLPQDFQNYARLEMKHFEDRINTTSVSEIFCGFIELWRPLHGAISLTRFVRPDVGGRGRLESIDFGMYSSEFGEKPENRMSQFKSFEIGTIYVDVGGLDMLLCADINR